MPKGRIVFGGQGEGYTKRKKIMKGTNPDVKPEVKQWNPAVAANASAVGKAGYAAVNMYPMTPLSVQDYATWYDYRLLPLNWPTVGSNSYERVGNSMFLRAFRFKGYIDVKGNLPQEFRWRIRLWRFRGGSPVYGTGTWVQQVQGYLGLFRNVEMPDANDTTETVHFRAVHNFFKPIKRLPKVYDYDCKVIMSGVIPGNNVHTEMATVTVGQDTEFSGTYAQTLSNERRFNLPIDVKVTCNDRITWSKTSDGSNDTTANVVYLLSLEDNYGVGVNHTNPSVSSNTVSWNWAGTATSWPVCFNFFIRGYFTDD